MVAAEHISALLAQLRQSPLLAEMSWEYFSSAAKQPERVIARLKNIRDALPACSVWDGLWLAAMVHHADQTLSRMSRWPVAVRRGVWEHLLALDGGQGWILPLLVADLPAEKNPSIRKTLCSWRPHPSVSFSAAQAEWLLRLIQSYNGLPADAPPGSLDIWFVLKGQLPSILAAHPEYRACFGDFWFHRWVLADQLGHSPYTTLMALADIAPQHPGWYSIMDRYLAGKLTDWPFSSDIRENILLTMAAWKPQTAQQREHLFRLWQSCLDDPDLQLTSERELRKLCCSALAHLVTGVWPPPDRVRFYFQMEFMMSRRGDGTERARWEMARGEPVNFDPARLPADVQQVFQKWLLDEFESFRDCPPENTVELLLALGTPVERLQPALTSRIESGTDIVTLQELARLTACFRTSPAPFLSKVWGQKLHPSQIHHQAGWKGWFNAVVKYPDPFLERFFLDLIEDGFNRQNISGELHVMEWAASKVVWWNPSDPEVSRSLFAFWMKVHEENCGRYMGNLALCGILHLHKSLPPHEAEAALHEAMVRELSTMIKYGSSFDGLNLMIKYRSSFYGLDLLARISFHHLSPEKMAEVQKLWQQLSSLMNMKLPPHAEPLGAETLAVRFCLSHATATPPEEFRDWFLSLVRTSPSPSVLHQLARWQPPTGVGWLDPDEEARAWADRLSDRTASPPVRIVAFTRLCSIWETTGDGNPAVPPELDRWRKALLQEEDPEVLWAVATRISSCALPVVRQVWVQTLDWMERHRPSLSATALILHNKFGMEHLLAGLLSRPDAADASLAVEWHRLIREGVFPAVSPAAPAWMGPAKVLARHLRPACSGDPFLKCLLSNLTHTSCSSIHFASLPDGPWEAVPVLSSGATMGGGCVEKSEEASPVRGGMAFPGTKPGEDDRLPYVAGWQGRRQPPGQRRRHGRFD
jgi:hypothetical protein